jgi:hypothetical protein
VAIAEEAAELEPGDPCSEKVDERAAGERKVDVVNETRLLAYRFETMVVNPSSKGTLDLLVHEKSVLLVLHMESDPLLRERSQRNFENDA